MEYLRQCGGISTGHASLTGEVYYTWPGGAWREAREGGGEGVREGGEKERREEREEGVYRRETKEEEGRRTCKKGIGKRRQRTVRVYLKAILILAQASPRWYFCLHE